MTEDGAAKAKTIKPWMNFKNIEVYDFTSGINEIVFNNRDVDYDAPYEVYNINGMKVGDNVDNLTVGTYIIRQGNKMKKFMKI